MDRSRHLLSVLEHNRNSPDDLWFGGNLRCRTLPSIPFSSRIHTSNTSGVIFQLLLNEQKTTPCSGKPTSTRPGVQSAICRRRSFG
jgi:hypothetical protein